MKIHHLTVEDAIRSLNSHPEGLSAREAARRHKEFGPNRVERVKKEPLALRFLKEFTHFFALILWLAAALAFVAECSDPGKGMAMLGWAILGVILINGLFSFWQEYRAEQALAALENLLPHQVNGAARRNIVQIPAVELVPGDMSCLAGRRRHPRRLPADRGFRRARQQRHRHRRIPAQSARCRTLQGR